MVEDTYILWLSRISGLGAKKIESLLEYFGDASEVWKADKQSLAGVSGLSEQNIHSILNGRDEASLESYVKELLDKKIRFISIKNPEYPTLLKEIYDPPAGFYLIGSMPKNAVTVGIIGSRRCSEYGLTTSHKISKDLSRQGIVIISGMARGIDSSAHLGALEGGGQTIAVLGCGVDICYPAENRILREKIIKSGCVISEYPPGTQPMPQHFPVRNRIISGLSNAIIVVEAAERSGTIITVEQALEQGRDVFAVPGNVTSKLSRGTNGLIKQGAALIENYLDVLHSLGLEEKTDSQKQEQSKIDKLLAPDEKLVYDCISMEPVTTDKIISEIDVQIHTVQYILTMLELKGYIQKRPGQRYIRVY